MEASLNKGINMNEAKLAILLALSSGLLVVSVAKSADDSCEAVGSSALVVERDINTPVPAPLKDAQITTKNKDGTERVVSANDYKVVPRKQQFIRKEVIRTVVVEREVPNKTIKRNRVSLLVGQGTKEGITVVQPSPGAAATVESNTGVIFGVSYQRLVSDTVSLGIQGVNNKSLMGSIGLDF